MTAQIGHGLDFQRSSDGTSGGTFATVGQITEPTLPNMTKDSVEKTHTKSPEKWREFFAGLKDAGEFSLDTIFDPSDPNVVAFLNEFNSDDNGYYKIIFPDATEWGFEAFMTAISPSSPIDDKMMSTITYKLSGKPGFIA